MTKPFSAVLRVSTQAVVALGDLGCFDEHGIFPMNVLRHQGQVWGYTCGWNRRVSVSVDTAIGLVVSDDQGLTFRRLGPGPILGPSLHEPFLVGDAFVINAGAGFHMWYMFGQRWKRETPGAAPDRVYKIGHATSVDLVTWVRDDAALGLSGQPGAWDAEMQCYPHLTVSGGVPYLLYNGNAFGRHGFGAAELALV